MRFRMRVPVGTVRRAALAGIFVVLCAGPSSRALAQTPSPLQEWQYSRGWVLVKLFELDAPDLLIFTGAAAERGPLYEGASASRTRAGPVLEFRYRDLVFASVGEGVGGVVRVMHPAAPDGAVVLRGGRPSLTARYLLCSAPALCMPGAWMSERFGAAGSAGYDRGFGSISGEFVPGLLRAARIRAQEHLADRGRHDQ